MTHWKGRILPAAVLTGTGLIGLLSVSAWFHIQAVRLTYRARQVERDMATLARRQWTARQQISENLALSRLDERARRRGLTVPRPDQIRLMPDPQ